MSIDIHFKTTGQGKDLVILHGLFGSGRNWQNIARHLSRHHRVFTLDLRNHGQSGHADSMSYSAMVEDLKNFLQQQSLTRVKLIGHSMGGKVAMTFAMNYESQVESLIVVDIAPVNYEHEFDHLIDAMLALDLSSLANRQQADAMLQSQIPDAGLRLFLLQNLVAHEGSFRWRINLPAIKRSLADISDFPGVEPASQYQGPSLFLRGEKSGYVLPEHHQALFSMFPNAKVSTVEGAGHWPHAEQPTLTLAAIESFLHSEKK